MTQMVLNPRYGETANRLMSVLINSDDPMTAQELADTLDDVNPATVRVVLRRLDQYGLVHRPYWGQYLAVRPRGESE